MDKITWKQVAMLAIFVIALLGCAALYTFGGPAGQEAAEGVGTAFVIILFLAWVFS